MYVKVTYHGLIWYVYFSTDRFHLWICSKSFFLVFFLSHVSQPLITKLPHQFSFFHLCLHPFTGEVSYSYCFSLPFLISYHIFIYTTPSNIPQNLHSFLLWAIPISFYSYLNNILNITIMFSLKITKLSLSILYHVLLI